MRLAPFAASVWGADVPTRSVVKPLDEAKKAPRSEGVTATLRAELARRAENC